MTNQSEAILKIDQQILRSDETIWRHLNNIDFLGRGAVSQDILANLRTFVEHVMFKIYAHENNTQYEYRDLTQAIEFIKKKGKLSFLWRFHSYLQIVSSHYTLEPEDSERVMLKYYEFMLKIKIFLKNNYELDVFRNLEKFPLNTDKNLQEYYKKIAERLNDRNCSLDKNKDYKMRYYIYKIKPFFVNQQVYYEVTFIPATGIASKFDRMIAFTKLDISKYYAVKLGIVEESINLLGKTMPIFIIVNWEVAIRPIEIENFSKIFSTNLSGYIGSAEVRGLMQFLTETGLNLVEIISFEDEQYREVRSKILSIFNAKVSRFFDLLDYSRNIVKNNKSGSNVLRYLLFQMNKRVIEDQLYKSNKSLSNLCLNYGCIPFDNMPFTTSLLNHNPKLIDLFECLDATNRKHELLARYILNNTEKNGRLYVSRTELERFGDVDVLVNTFNKALYDSERHQARRLEERNKHFYISGYENDTISIIKKLIELSSSGVQNYTDFVDGWLNSEVHIVDCEEKKESLRKLFTQSSVALIYGSAGTGKSTLINHVSNLFKNQSKLYLANTNPAVDNMKRKISIQTDDTEFTTITKFIKKQKSRTKYDMVFIDECSTVNNRDMKEILNKADFELLILVGDIYQIESIQFGNWFNAAKSFLPESSISYLTKPYRSHNDKLQTLWDRTRNMDDKILETITRNQYSKSLDSSIFTQSEPDEIILCLNYDGLYGINNINRFLQQANPNPAFSWGLQLYKIGDPILFNESDRFMPLIYNNIKGWIIDIKLIEGKIQFDIEIDKPINGLEAASYDFELLETLSVGRSIIRFVVDDYRSIDENFEILSTASVPFQVAYAVSIHKAQGLEFNSVKVIIDNGVEDHINHSIFYTAITRARENLKIYWTPEIENKILSSIKPKDIKKEIIFLEKILTQNIKS